MRTVLRKYSFWLSLLSFGGMVAAFWQTAEKIHFLKNPDVALSCNLNPIVDCGTVLNHELSSVFGVANSLIGIVAFSILFAAGIMLLLGVKANRNMKKLILVLAAVMFGFSLWFYIVSLYVIGKICLFCVGIWTFTIPLFLATLREYDAGLFKNKKTLRALRVYLADNLSYSILLLYILAIGVFFLRFRDYYL